MQKAVLNARAFRPLYVKIKINYGCNLKCQMGKHWRETRETPIPMQRFKETISELAELGCKKIHFSGGVTDVIEDGKNGVLVKVNDADGLAEKLLQVLNQPENNRTLSKAAREAVIHRFTPEKELDANLQVYQRLGLKI